MVYKELLQKSFHANRTYFSNKSRKLNAQVYEIIDWTLRVGFQFFLNSYGEPARLFEVFWKLHP